MALTDPPFNYETQVPNYESQLSLVSLWGNFVPTMNVYSTFDSPRFYYFISHLPELDGAVARSSPDPILVKRRWWTYAHLDAVSSKRLQALASVMFCTLPEGDIAIPDEAVLRRQWGPTTAGDGKLCIPCMNTVIPTWEITVLQMWWSHEMRHRYWNIFGGLHLIRDSRSSFRNKSKSRLSRQAAGKCFSKGVLFEFKRIAPTTRFFYFQCNIRTALF